MLVQPFELQGRRFTNFYIYYYYNMPNSLSVCCAPEGERLSVRQALTNLQKCWLRQNGTALQPKTWVLFCLTQPMLELGHQHSIYNLKLYSQAFRECNQYSMSSHRFVKCGKIQGDGQKFLDRLKSSFGSQISSQSLRSISTDYCKNPQQRVSFIIYFGLWVFQVGTSCCPLTFDLISQ